MKSSSASLDANASEPYQDFLPSDVCICGILLPENLPTLK